MTPSWLRWTAPVVLVSVISIAAVVALWAPAEPDPATAPLTVPAAPDIEQLRARAALAGYATAPDAIPVLGVEVQRLPAGGLDLMAALDVHYPSVSDPDGALRGALGSPPVLPLSYLVAPDGRVMQVNPPEVFRDPAQVRTAVERYLGPQATG